MWQRSYNNSQEVLLFFIDIYYERHKEAIEAAKERIHKDQSRAPEGYYTLAEFDELFHKKLDE